VQDDVSDEVTGRDVLNERPTADEAKVVHDTQHQLGRQAIIRTTMGDIHMKLFRDECPRTVENFTVHARQGYYDNVIFHRVIKGFMVQTGDPGGDGTGGESIWGGEFGDEFHRSLRHDRPFTVSMANSGPNTNGSQFFITTVPTPWLDNKHTIFARVTQGMAVVQEISNVKIDPATDKPYTEIKIINVEVL
jgi:peptidylprolyl isomerase domain and WD repeat-containing protein 1